MTTTPALEGSATPTGATLTVSSSARTRLVGLAVATGGLLLAVLAHRLVPQVGLLTWAIGLGVVAANVGLLPRTAATGLALVTRRLLRIGIVLLGFAVSFGAIAALGLPLIAVVVVSLAVTLGFTTWLGRRLGLPPARALLVATGTAICGASAIAAMEDTAEADEEDVAVAIAMVTLFGTLALVALPLLAGPLGLTGPELGMWAGASIHEVGQVVAAASPAGGAAVAVAVVVKLTRVVLLAPAVATVSIIRRISAADGGRSGTRTPIVPLFVLGFLACVALRSTGAVPQQALEVITYAQVATLGAALFGMGTCVRLASLVRGSRAVLTVAAAGTVLICGTSLAGILLVG